MIASHLKNLSSVAMAAACLLALSGAQSAMAQSAYGEVGYAAMTTSLSVPLIGLSASAQPSMVRAMVGIAPLGGLAIEGIASAALSDDSFVSTGASSSAVRLGNAKVNQIMGVYLASNLNFGLIQLYGRAGWAKSEVQYSGLGNGNGSDFSYGGGVRLIPGDSFTLSADYMNYLNKDGARIEGYTLSLGYRF